jgi:hypothetical protein
MRSTSDGCGDLEVLCRRLRRWRERHGGRGKRIPEALWDEAAVLARRDGVESVARALRVDGGGLARRVRAKGAEAERRSEAGTGFVELSATELSTAERSTIELVNGTGERLRIEIPGRVDVQALLRGFRELGG